ncbi:hypothetical protein EYF80_017843 [Liparis tanakae]|uniref:Uncharacterized protein n=1 Tax=Liparis tanakae TaxID=230148 RepID=A0A4Z2I3K7_9TELE|nr:hypothetical protein EYF80_017843 [Liparis tanakae]
MDLTPFDRTLNIETSPSRSFIAAVEHVGARGEEEEEEQEEEEEEEEEARAPHRHPDNSRITFHPVNRLEP